MNLKKILVAITALTLPMILMVSVAWGDILWPGGRIPMSMADGQTKYVTWSIEFSTQHDNYGGAVMECLLKDLANSFTVQERDKIASGLDLIQIRDNPTGQTSVNYTGNTKTLVIEFNEAAVNGPSYCQDSKSVNPEVFKALEHLAGRFDRKAPEKLHFSEEALRDDMQTEFLQLLSPINSQAAQQPQQQGRAECPLPQNAPKATR